MKHPLAYPLILALFFSLWACESDSQSPAGSASPDVPGAFSEKTPTLPTTFVDTSGKTYPWHKAYNQVQSIRSRIKAPEGFQRAMPQKGSFGKWLQNLPLKPGNPAVRLHNGEKKGNQSAHYRVIDLDVGKRDLQQCADAVMRLRAEYLYSQEQYADIHFNFTSGHACRWEQWRQGYRPQIKGNKVNFVKTAGADDGYKNFRSYMDKVFTYAGTASLAKELDRVVWEDLQIGDVFIQGGFPGHAILVVDVATEASTGRKAFLVAQSYMPAQEMHVLKNPMDPEASPWYYTDFEGDLETPEWTFAKADLKRF